jgi:hypothetical protein
MANRSSRRPYAALVAVLIWGLAACLARAQFTSHNVSLYDHLDLVELGAGSGSSCWGYVSPSGQESALA